MAGVPGGRPGGDPPGDDPPGGSDPAGVSKGVGIESVTAWVNRVRSMRAELYQRVQAGLGIEEVLAAVDGDPVLAATKLLPVLESRPGATKIATRRQLGELGIDLSTVLGALTADQRAAVASAFGRSTSR